MINRIILLICIISANQIFAQKEVLGQYPMGQNFYIGGIDGLNKEMVKIVKEQNIPPCENIAEEYTVQVLVNEDSSINYVKDFDSIKIQKNKCAFDISRKLIPNLKRWIPAKEQDKFVAAIAKIEIKPFYLYYSKDEPRKNETKNPVYSKGMASFGNEVTSIFQSRINKNEDKRSALLFVVNEKGEMEDFKIEGDYTESEKKSIIKDLSRIKGKWQPATFNGIPIKTRLRQPLLQNFDLQMQAEEMRRSADQNIYNNRYR
ncbi:hypothetical protein N0B16_09425 [Chryseobacterium sp. GMJ5]|uniref:TonB C-terminal domain-containing protein n=1 Tax=Chryseobacterium gilvum TaxID=2976534 RepID=A0ABT2VXC7_9FLAO|nr:hypothetical protein [Chryseobacterium gilvum]MCU7614653.1 hypothetical protein [Chryseobacterium gilvum]